MEGREEEKVNPPETHGAEGPCRQVRPLPSDRSDLADLTVVVGVVVGRRQEGRSRDAPLVSGEEEGTEDRGPGPEWYRGSFRQVRDVPHTHLFEALPTIIVIKSLSLPTEVLSTLTPASGPRVFSSGACRDSGRVRTHGSQGGVR